MKNKFKIIPEIKIETDEMRLKRIIKERFDNLVSKFYKFREINM